jgi:hypothetical protein
VSRRTFLPWFAAQFGEEPSPGQSLSDLEESLNAARREYDKALFRLGERLTWLARHNAALRAWCAGRERAK